MDLVKYGVVPGRLTAGNYPGSLDPATARRKLRALLDDGVRSFVDLTEDGEVTLLGPLRPYDSDLRDVGTDDGLSPSYARYPIRDLGVPTRGFMIQILDALDAALGNGTPAYVHCLGGRERGAAPSGCA